MADPRASDASAPPPQPPRRKPAPLVCANCGRSDKEAPAAVINERGRFCADCMDEGLRWPA